MNTINFKGGDFSPPSSSPLPGAAIAYICALTFLVNPDERTIQLSTNYEEIHEAL